MCTKWWLFLGLAMAAGCCSSSPKFVHEPRVAPPVARVGASKEAAKPVDEAATAPAGAQFVSVDKKGLVWVHAEDAEVREVAGEIARAGRINLIIDPSVTAHVTLDSERLRAREALELVARASGCELEEYHAPR
jgi:hypothetical protein